MGCMSSKNVFSKNITFSKMNNDNSYIHKIEITSFSNILHIEKEISELEIYSIVIQTHKKNIMDHINFIETKYNYLLSEIDSILIDIYDCPTLEIKRKIYKNDQKLKRHFYYIKVNIN